MTQTGVVAHTLLKFCANDFHSGSCRENESHAPFYPRRERHKMQLSMENGFVFDVSSEIICTRIKRLFRSAKRNHFCFVNISLAGILQRLDVFRQDCWESTRKGFSSLLWNKKEAGAELVFVSKTVPSTVLQNYLTVKISSKHCLIWQLPLT